MKHQVSKKRPHASMYRKWINARTLAIVIVVLGFGGIGVALLQASHAASYAATSETESGTLGGGAKIVSDSAASGDAAVKFGNQGSTGGGGSSSSGSKGSGGSSGGSGSSSSSPTAATCPHPKPTAPVTGYTISACEDFNNGLGAFAPYSGGGSGTVVGTGRTPSQCTVTGGMLELKQDSNGATCGGWMNGFDQQYGYWEVRMRAYSTGNSNGSEPHPVLILWPGDGQWTSELDFFETDIGNPAGGFLHCTSNPSQNCYVLPSNSVDYSKWHVYGIQWTANSMTGYIDGTKWWSTSDISSFNPLADSNLTIQLDNLSGSTPVDPGEMDIDWAHMYK